MAKHKNDVKVRRYFRGDPAENLLKAVGDWARSRGGSVLVAGGVQVQKWPADPEFTFYVAVRCTGRAPEVKTEGVVKAKAS